MIGRTLAGRYRIERLIGRGGVGLVYLARRSSSAYPVVVKVLAPSSASNPEALARFKREAERLNSLTHPNIVKMLDFGQDAGRAFIVMEYLDGQLLEERLQAQGRLPTEVFVPIAAQILKGLGYAHSRGVIHRDLKPSNIMLVTPDAKGDFVKILDFGLAKLVETENQITQQHVVGTAGFLSPEQIQGEPVDQRADVYALGVLFYTMLSGQLPFTADSNTALFYKHVHQKPRPLEEHLPVNHGVPAELLRLIHVCLAKDPDERPGDAMELLEEIIDCVDASLMRAPVLELGASKSGTMVGLGFHETGAHDRLRSPAPSRPPAQTVARGVTPAPMSPRASSASRFDRPEFELSSSRADLAPIRAVEGSNTQTGRVIVAIGAALALLGAAVLAYVLTGSERGERAPERGEQAAASPPEQSAEDTLSTAENLLEGGQFDAAMKVLERYATRYEGDPALQRRAAALRKKIKVGKLFAVARRLEERDNLEAALEAYRDVLELEPSHTLAQQRIKALSGPEDEAAVTGNFTVVSEILANVFVDDTPVGPTNFVGRLPVGEHDIRVEAAGYRAWEDTVTIEPGDRNKPLHVTLKRARGRAGKASAKSTGQPTKLPKKPRPGQDDAPDDDKDNLFLPTKKKKADSVFLSTQE